MPLCSCNPSFNFVIQSGARALNQINGMQPEHWVRRCQCFCYSNKSCKSIEKLKCGTNMDTTRTTEEDECYFIRYCALYENDV